ncbi:Trigger factor [Rhynchospora pubera]|uniref:Trigger factor n=1 Tax=Rhynchospora pubera TaxID=906938 RepID=A0AAV8E736_9POAL|nr:Trigger factor [Rhynchospora pubera]
MQLHPGLSCRSGSWAPVRLRSDVVPPSSCFSAFNSTLRNHSSLLRLRLRPMAHSSPSVDELNSIADFERIASSSSESESEDAYISICGFGSLLSERSARSTFPHLLNFRLAQLRGFRRVFAHVAPIFFDRGIANPHTGVGHGFMGHGCVTSILLYLLHSNFNASFGLFIFQEISSLSVEPCQHELLIVTVFEINIHDVPSFLKREEEFRFLAVYPEGLDGTPFPNRAVLCARYSDEEYFQVRCQGNKLRLQFFLHYVL